VPTFAGAYGLRVLAGQKRSGVALPKPSEMGAQTKKLEPPKIVEAVERVLSNK
jgi:hypothetical protein